MTGAELETTSPGELTEAQESALAQEALSAMEGERVQLPLLKLTQQLSGEVTRGEANSGEFVNTLTDANYGPEVGIVIVATAKGRFYSPEDDDNSYVAQNTDIVPNNWPDEFAGKRFDELPEAEETYRQRVNDGEIPWGRGPAIRTTYNYVGFVPDDPDVPVRLSLQRTSKPAADKINTILRFALRSPWAAVIDLKAVEQTDSKDRPYYIVRAAKGRPTTDEERAGAIALYQNIQRSEVELSGEENLERAERKDVERDDDISIT